MVPDYLFRNVYINEQLWKTEIKTLSLEQRAEFFFFITIKIMSPSLYDKVSHATSHQKKICIPSLRNSPLRLQCAGITWASFHHPMEMLQPLLLLWVINCPFLPRLISEGVIPESLLLVRFLQYKESKKLSWKKRLKKENLEQTWGRWGVFGFFFCLLKLKFLQIPAK